MTTPIAFVDVDGVLNRLCAAVHARDRGLVRRHGFSAGNRWPLWLDVADRDRLTRLAQTFQLAWGTTWERDADEAIALPLGVPRPELVAHTLLGERSKAFGVVRAAAGRPFVWLDHDPSLAKMCGSITDQAHLVIEVEPAEGLTDEHIEDALAWWGRTGREES